MDLSYVEIEDYLEQIFTASKLVDVDGITILLKHPDNKILMQARRIYNAEYKESIDEGLLSTKDMQKIIEDRNLIPAEEREKISRLESKLEAQKVLLAKTTKVKANQDRIKGIIQDLEEDLRQLRVKERSKLSMTADNRAEESKILFLSWSGIYNFETDSKYWENYKDFLNESNLDFRNRVISEFIIFYSGIPTPQIRAVARSNLWRIRYITSIKASEPLFGVPTSEYTNDMLNLAYWSHFYQNVYEMMPDDQPPQEIIEDDGSLDAYLDDFYRERNRENATRRQHKKSGSGKLSSYNQQEVIVTRSNELYEDIDYDKPREAQAIKDRNLVRKKTRKGGRSKRGDMPQNLPRR